MDTRCLGRLLFHLWIPLAGFVGAPVLAPQAGGVCGAGLSQDQSPGELSGALPLFLGAPSQAVDPASVSETTATRHWRGQVNPALLEDCYPARGDRLLLNITEDHEVLAVVEHVAVRSAVSRSCLGRLEEGGVFSLTREQGELLVHITSADGGAFEVRCIHQGLCEIARLPLCQGPVCAPSAVDLPGNEAISEISPSRLGDSAADDGQVIDLLVAHTPAARVGAGGADALLGLVRTAVDWTNLCFSNSLIQPRIRLVGFTEIEYVESRYLNDDLGHLRGAGDGVMDEVHGLRDLCGADLVCLIVEGGDASGSAYVMTDLSPAFDAFAFSIVTRPSLPTSFVFTHELGHNLGCAHDHQSGGPGLFAHAHGHRFSGAHGGLFRTIMAYPPGLSIAHFSNPRVSHDGAPTGIEAGLIDSADNVSTINTAALTAANWRLSAESTLPQFQAHASDVPEGTGSATIEIEMSHPSDLVVQIDYETVGETAVDGQDYERRCGRLVFAPGETQRAIEVPILNDLLCEGDELFGVQLSNALNADCPSSEVSVIILDDDQPESAALAHMLGSRALSQTERAAADANRDGRIDAADVVVAVRGSE